MGVFLRLSEAQLRPPSSGNHLSQHILERATGKQARHEFIQVTRILHQPECRGKIDPARPGEAIESRVEERAQQLARAVGAEIGHQQRIPVHHARIGGNHRRRHKLVTFTSGISGSQRCLDIQRRGSRRFGHREIGARDSLPALIAIHRPVASAHSADGELPRPRNVRLEFADILPSRGRWCISPVEKGVQRHRYASAVKNVDQCRDMILMRVHAARRQQAHQMAAPTAPAQFIDEIRQRRQASQGAIGDGRIDTR